MEQELNQEQKEVADKLEQIINDGNRRVNNEPPLPPPPTEKPPEPTPTETDVPVEAQILLDLPEQVLKDLMNGCFNTVSLRLGDNWKLSIDESEKLSHYLHIVLLKYKLTLSPEIALILWTSLIIGSRAMSTDWKKVLGKSKVIEAEKPPEKPPEKKEEIKK